MTIIDETTAQTIFVYLTQWKQVKNGSNYRPMVIAF